MITSLSLQVVCAQSMTSQLPAVEEIRNALALDALTTDAALAQLLALSQSETAAEVRDGARLLRGDLMSKTQSFDQAEAVYRGIVGSSAAPETVEWARLHLGEVILAQQRYDEASQVLTALHDDQPSSTVTAQAVLAILRCCDGMKDLKGAVQWQRRNIELERDPQQRLMKQADLAHRLVAAVDPFAAEKVYEELIGQKAEGQDLTGVRIDLSNGFARLNVYEKAIQYLEIALANESVPDRTRLKDLQRLVGYQLKIGETDKAISAFTEMLDLSGEDGTDGLLQAFKADVSGEKEAALDRYEKYMADFPQSAMAREARSYAIGACQKLKRREAALGLLKADQDSVSALTQTEQYIAATRMLAAYALNTGRPDEAMQIFLDAVQPFEGRPMPLNMSMELADRGKSVLDRSVASDDGLTTESVETLRRIVERAYAQVEANLDQLPFWVPYAVYAQWGQHEKVIDYGQRSIAQGRLSDFQLAEVNLWVGVANMALEPAATEAAKQNFEQIIALSRVENVDAPTAGAVAMTERAAPDDWTVSAYAWLMQIALNQENQQEAKAALDRFKAARLMDTGIRRAVLKRFEPIIAKN